MARTAIPYTPQMQVLCSRIGAARRGGDTETEAEARRDYAALRIQAFIEITVAEAPPLTQEQRDHLAHLLGSGQVIRSGQR